MRVWLFGNLGGGRVGLGAAEAAVEGLGEMTDLQGAGEPADDQYARHNGHQHGLDETSEPGGAGPRVSQSQFSGGRSFSGRSTSAMQIISRSRSSLER